MKRFYMVYSIALIMALVFVGTAAAEGQRPENKRGLFVGGFGGPSVKAGILSDTQILFIGGRGGVRLTRSFSLGGGGYFGLPYDKAGEVGIGYGGVWAEYALFPEKRVYPSVKMLFGGGGVGYLDDDGSEKSKGFFIAEPGVNLNVKLTEFLCISPGIKYMWTSPDTFSALEKDGIGGLQATLMLKFGKLD